MTRRPAVTLIEVLVTLFIMAIGMLALLVLFPLGAISMGHALKDDRCASTAAMAENVAIAMNVRHDSAVTGFTNAGSPVYVDPYGSFAGFNTVGTPPLSTIPRVGLSFVTSPQLADRWLSLPDDLAFSTSGQADVSQTGGILDRGRRYSFAYLLTPLGGPSQLVNLTVVVYAARPVNSLNLEQTYTANGAQGSNGVVVTWAGPQPTPNVRRGGWILDTGGNFYRVTNIADAGAGSMVLDVSPNLKAAVGGIIVMDDVAEVFDKGTGWQP